MLGDPVVKKEEGMMIPEIYTITCFHCHLEFGYEGEQYRDIICPRCHVENSVYNPADCKTPLKEENENNL